MDRADRLEVITNSPGPPPRPARVYRPARVAARAQGANLAVVRLAAPDPLP